MLILVSDSTFTPSTFKIPKNRFIPPPCTKFSLILVPLGGALVPCFSSLVPPGISSPGKLSSDSLPVAAAPPGPPLDPLDPLVLPPLALLPLPLPLGVPVLGKLLPNQASILSWSGLLAAPLLLAIPVAHITTGFSPVCCAAGCGVSGCSGVGGGGGVGVGASASLSPAAAAAVEVGGGGGSGGGGGGDK